ncbi:kelch repeat-containing family protein [Striga asiatica]|uniref:Kelch repeat-containing family protein n=1 Tax=Striga asiatica TaxID=4170 RepID=A0A5A7RE01_STRAF|nr:kelch repeat-containing family protein [Striga asiatica]
MAANSKWARFLEKSQLGGVIFGCTNNTMEECLTSQLFGLPAKHFKYVQNIEPGLPLFLFNYSDRKLHGIYEAVSSGQLNINQYAWTAGGPDKTKFPAQVQVRVRTKCEALPEHQFKPIIANNYYNQVHFRFELDHAQTTKLLSKMSPSAVSPSQAPTPKKAQKWTPVVKSSPSKNKREESGACEPSSLPKEDGANYATSDDSQTLNEMNNQLKEPSPCDQNYETIQNYDEKDLLYIKLKELALSGELSDAIMMGDVVEGACMENADLEHEKHDDAVANLGKWKGGSTLSSLDYPVIISQLWGEIEELKSFKQQQALEIKSWKKKLVEAQQKIDQLENRCMILESVSNSSSTISSNEALVGHNAIKSSLNESIFILGGYDGVSWSAALNSVSPTCDVLKFHKPMSAVRGNASVARLHGELYVFGGGTDSLWYDTVESYNVVDDQWTARPSLTTKKKCLAVAALGDKFYLVGGGSEVECLSEVEMFDPSVGIWVSARPMLEKRFAVAAVECHGAVYAVGGFDGNDYLKSAERFDPREPSWTRISSMNMKRGGHSLVVLNEKLYAIGGHDGETMVPSVEIYDVRMGTWTAGESLNQGRAYLAAAVLKNSIYVIGGLKAGPSIIDSIECYKEGQGRRETNLKSVGNICYTSAVVLGDD